MGTAKGNLGTLMQHWTWGETLHALQQDPALAGMTLHVVDAHAMAPAATVCVPDPPPTGALGRFARVRAGLPGAGSPYEVAWADCQAEAPDRYPSTASLTVRQWRGPLVLDLCEIDDAVADEIDAWAAALPGVRPDVQARARRGDWRRFLVPQFQPAGDLLAVTFDPMRFSVKGRSWWGDSRLFPDDLARLLDATASLELPMVVFLTTYDHGRGASPHPAIVDCWDTALGVAGFERAGPVAPDCNAMAAVYARALPPAAGRALLDAEPQRAFMQWLRKADPKHRQLPTGCPELFRHLDRRGTTVGSGPRDGRAPGGPADAPAISVQRG